MLANVDEFKYKGFTLTLKKEREKEVQRAEAGNT